MKDSYEDFQDIDIPRFNKYNLKKGQQIEIDITRILLRENEMEGFRHGTRAECTYLGNVQDAKGAMARVSYEFYEGEPEIIYYQEIKNVIQ